MKGMYVYFTTTNKWIDVKGIKNTYIIFNNLERCMIEYFGRLVMLKGLREEIYSACIWFWTTNNIRKGSQLELRS